MAIDIDDLLENVGEERKIKLEVIDLNSSLCKKEIKKEESVNNTSFFNIFSYIIMYLYSITIDTIQDFKQFFTEYS